MKRERDKSEDGGRVTIWRSLMIRTGGEEGKGRKDVLTRRLVQPHLR